MVWPRGAECDQAAQAFSVERFTDALVGRPATTARAWDVQAYASEAVRLREIGDLDVDVPLPDVAWHLLVRWYAEFGQVPVPLRPRGLLVFG